jgi:hypothetical protein
MELELVAGGLRTVPELVTGHPQNDPAGEERIAPVACGLLKLGVVLGGRGDA